MGTSSSSDKNSGNGATKSTSNQTVLGECNYNALNSKTSISITSNTKSQKKYIVEYRLGRTMDCSSFHKSKMALHEPTKKKFVIQMIDTAKLNSQNLERTAKLENELNLQSSLNHPNVHQIKEVIHTPSTIYVVKEYLNPSGDLFDYIVQKGRLSESEARKFFQQMIFGLQHCHYKSVAHRDIRPENILLDSNKNIYISSFELATRIKDHSLLLTSCGSPNYASPEIIRGGEPYIGQAADIWSTGVVLYAMLCGTLPFNDESVVHLFNLIQRGEFRMPDFLSPSVRDLLKRMININPLERITIEEIKRHQWFLIHLPKYLTTQYEYALDEGKKNENPRIMQRNECMDFVDNHRRISLCHGVTYLIHQFLGSAQDMQCYEHEQNRMEELKGLWKVNKVNANQQPNIRFMTSSDDDSALVYTRPGV